MPAKRRRVGKGAGTALYQYARLSTRHARACRGHPRLKSGARPKTWMAGTSPAMTWRVRRFQCKSVLLHGRVSRAPCPPGKGAARVDAAWWARRTQSSAVQESGATAFAHPTTTTQPRLHRLEAAEIEEARQIIDLASARRRGAADEVEDLAVLDAVIGEPLDPAVLVEIDRDHALIDGLLGQEGDRPLGALGDVVEGLT